MKKAIVIGASSGIRKELAITLAKNGYEVGLMARRTKLLEVLKNELPAKSHIRYIDISNVSDAIDKLRNMIQTMEGIDLVVINSGTGFLNFELDCSKEQQTINVNLNNLIFSY